MFCGEFRRYTHDSYAHVAMYIIQKRGQSPKNRSVSLQPSKEAGAAMKLFTVVAIFVHLGLASVHFLGPARPKPEKGSVRASLLYYLQWLYSPTHEIFHDLIIFPATVQEINEVMKYFMSR